MFQRLVEDLRFVIGLFFLIVGAILLGVGVIDPQTTAGGLHLNLGSGALMALFGAAMIALSVLVPLNDSHA